MERPVLHKLRHQGRLRPMAVIKWLVVFMLIHRRSAEGSIRIARYARPNPAGWI